MPFKSEKQRRYLWANEPEIARDWTETYGNRIKKNEGGIMNRWADQGGMKNYLGEQPMVNAPQYWRSGPDSPPTELAYITDAEKDLILQSNLHDSLANGPNEGPSGIMSLDSQGDYTRDRSPAGKQSSPGGPDRSRQAQAQHEQHMKSILTGQQNIGQTAAVSDRVRQGGTSPLTSNLTNLGSNINPLRWAGALIKNPVTRGIYGLATNLFPSNFASNMRGGMTQSEYEQARQQRIANQRIQNILGREAPITEMTQGNLADLYKQAGVTSGFVPDVGSTPQKRAITKDFEREGDDITYARSHLASLADQMGTQTAKKIPFEHDLEASVPIRGAVYPRRSSEGIQQIADLNNMGYDEVIDLMFNRDQIKPVSSYSEFDTIPVDKYKGLQIQRNYQGEPIGSDLVQEAGLTDKQKELLDQRKHMLETLGDQAILDTITSEDDPDDPATLEDVRKYYGIDT